MAWRRLRTFVSIMALVAGASMTQPLVRDVEAASAPKAAGSWYITKYDTTWAYNHGCTLGTNVAAGTGPQNALVILDFFTQYQSGSAWGTEGDDKVFHPISAAEAIAFQFARGYWICTGSDSTARLVIAMGTRNIWWPSTLTVAQVGARGTEWAGVVAATQASLGAYASQVTIDGAIDAELSWASPNYTLAWANGYASPGSSLYYNYGDAAGCPPYGSCNGGYTQANVYDLAWGISAAVVSPEIYYTSPDLSAQWQQISLWGYLHRSGVRIAFSSVTTEHAAAPTTLTPTQGWTALFNKLNGDSRTSLANIEYSTDFQWDTRG